MAEEENTEENGEENSGGGGKKLLIIGLLAGLIVGGGGAAGALMMMGGGDEEAAEVVEEVEEEKPKEFHYVKMERFNAPMMHKGRVLSYVMLDLSLEVESNEKKLLLVRNMPIIRDAFLKDVTSRPIGKPESPQIIDYAGLTKRLTNISNKVVREKIVNKALVVQATRL